MGGEEQGYDKERGRERERGMRVVSYENREREVEKGLTRGPQWQPWSFFVLSLLLLVIISD